MNPVFEHYGDIFINHGNVSQIVNYDVTTPDTMLRKHLEAFIEMVCHEGQRGLCEHSERIREITDEQEDEAA